jgi:hypothetical protein
MYYHGVSMNEPANTMITIDYSDGTQGILDREDYENVRDLAADIAHDLMRGGYQIRAQSDLYLTTPDTEYRYNDTTRMVDTAQVVQAAQITGLDQRERGFLASRMNALTLLAPATRLAA